MCYCLSCERFGGQIVSIMDSGSASWAQMLAKVIVIVLDKILAASLSA